MRPRRDIWLSFILLLIIIICLTNISFLFHWRVAGFYNFSWSEDKEQKIGLFKLASPYIPKNIKETKTVEDQLPLDDDGLRNANSTTVAGTSIIKVTSSRSNDDDDSYVYNVQEYEEQLFESMKPSPNESTGSYWHGFYGGFCNQYFMFLGVTLLVLDLNYTQMYAGSIRWNDLYGTETKVRHEALFDVVHWNSFYPTLPKIVHHDSNVFTDVYLHYDERGSPIENHATNEKILSKQGEAPRMIWYNGGVSYLNATKPYAIGGAPKTIRIANNRYKQFFKRLQGDKTSSSELTLYSLVVKEAFRPHPELQLIINNYLSKTIQQQQSQNHDKKQEYIVLHARIEPDMQKHPMCQDKKVTNFTEIIELLHSTFQSPPASKLIILLNRGLLEEEVEKHHRGEESNILAVHNLQVLNHVMKHGLWDGQTQVIEAGSRLAKESNHAIYSKYTVISGGIINFFLSLRSKIFIGTEVSSYSTSIVNSRYYRNQKKNYFYIPGKLILKESHHRFQC
mmetsp:Transcript_10557/g.11645  ORF Transcript_10557/g.11645 Transcript_10557/m.11645 type:complete len:508 (+) Transcript_10557:144-1667(+)